VLRESDTLGLAVKVKAPFNRLVVLTALLGTVVAVVASAQSTRKAADCNQPLRDG
jgi:hypothetical protein